MALVQIGIKSKDDRGRAVFLGAFGTGSQDAAQENANDPGLAELRMRLSAVITPKPAWNENLSARQVTTILIWLALPVSAILLSMLVPGAPPWAYGLVVLPLVLIIARLAMNRNLREHETPFVDGFLHEGRCPSCAYAIHGVPAAEDGCVVCPECGAAWKSSRIGERRVAPAPVRDFQRRVTSPTGVEQWLGAVRTPLVTTDARGRAVYIIDPLLRRVDPETARRIGEHRLHATRKRMRRMHRWAGVALGVCLSFAIPALLIGVWTRRSGSGFVSVTLGIVTTVFILWVVWSMARMLYAMIWGEAGLRVDRASRVLLNSLICPGCCAPLDDVEPDEHGICECATCHAAWHVPRHPGADSE